MAHNLFQNRMAFVDEVPWHGLGTRVPSTVGSTEMIEAANLAWRVEKVPAPGARLLDSEKKLYDRYLVQRDPVGTEEETVAFAIVGQAYEPVQNADAFRFFEPFVDAKWAEFHTAGALGNGERVWVLAKLNSQICIGEDDVIDRFILLSNTHDGTSAVTVRFTPIRVVCQNTLNLAQKEGKAAISFRHSRNVLDHIAKAQVSELKFLIDKVFSEAETLFGQLALRSVRTVDIDRYLHLLFPQTDEHKRRGQEPERWIRIRSILDDDKVTPTATRGTLWALYNAVVRDEDFRASRESGADARLERVWFGRGQDMKLKALENARSMLKSAA